ncbi:MAG: hypothetical protein LBE85_04430 [Candidatus Accumulibacter sp.]|jgi:tetratricopeptide (TPR) repeat protein|nr:hypothetical protein [Accumulibacter sp.]
MPFSEPYSEVVEIQPFWQRMPYFFLYPLHFEPLVYLLLLSGVTLLGLLALPWLIFLFVILVFVRYAYKTLDQTALGLLRPDQDLPVFDDESRTSLLYKQFGILLVIGFVIELARRSGGLFYGAALIYGTLSMPAATMTLAVTRSFWSAINPFAVIGMMSTIGMPYLGLSAFIFLLSASSSVLAGFLAPRVPQWLLLPTLAFVMMYFTLIMFVMMGYVVYQYHQALGLNVRKTGQTGRKPGAGSAAGSGGQVDSYAELISSGQIDKALDQAYEEKRVDPENVAANDRYHKLLLLSHSSSGQRILARVQEAERRGDPANVRQYLEAELSRYRERLLSHTRSHLALLLKKNLTAEAVGVYRSTREQIPDFELEEPAHVLSLARAARQARDPALALSLIKGFDKRFPRSNDIPDVYFFAAQTLSEDYREDAKARQILAHLLKRFPQHPLGDKARQLLDFMEKTARE